MLIIEYNDKYLEDVKDYYHMVPIIDNIIYDKNYNCMNLYVISVYRKDKLD